MKKMLLALVLSLFLAIPASAQSAQFVNPFMEGCTAVGEGAPVPGWNGTATCTFDTLYGNWWAKIGPDGYMCQDVNATGKFIIEVCSYDASPNDQSQRIIAYDGLRQVTRTTATGKNWRVCPHGIQSNLGELQNPTICIRNGYEWPDVDTRVHMMFLYVDEYPVAAEEETTVEFSPLGLCRGAVASCWSSSSPPLDLYINGLWSGPCSGDVPFYPRGIHSDTMTLVNTSGIGASYTITRHCDIAIQMGNPFPTPTPYAIHPLTQTMASPGGGFLGIDFRYQGGRLLWLEWATALVNLVNSGNLLYIVGAVLMAGMVLSWAIAQVKNPRSW